MHRPVDKRDINPSMDHGQHAVWSKIRTLKAFVMADLWGCVDMERNSIRNYLRRLEAGGYIARETSTINGLKQPNRYTLINDTGRKAPRLTLKGRKVTQGHGRRNMWRTMSHLKEFTVQEIELHSNTSGVSVSRKSVMNYCNTLLLAGYLVLTSAHSNDGANVYRMVRRTGPLHPKIQRNGQIFDPNLGAVVCNLNDHE